MKKAVEKCRDRVLIMVGKGYDEDNAMDNEVTSTN